MQLPTKQQIGALATACLISSAFCAPVEQTDGQVLDTRQTSNRPLLQYWTEEKYEPANVESSVSEAEGRVGLGDCNYLGGMQDRIRSAKAPDGWKCTFYNHKGCHGDRTKEFDVNGIEKIDGKMFMRASAWRCCEIGKTNYWGYCSLKLSPGS